MSEERQETLPCPESVGSLIFRVVEAELYTSKYRLGDATSPDIGGHPLGALKAPGSSAKHGDGVGGNARREVSQGAELGIARVYNQVPPSARCSWPGAAPAQ